MVIAWWESLGTSWPYVGLHGLHTSPVNKCPAISDSHLQSSVAFVLCFIPFLSVSLSAHQLVPVVPHFLKAFHRLAHSYLPCLLLLCMCVSQVMWVVIDPFLVRLLEWNQLEYCPPLYCICFLMQTMCRVSVLTYTPV